MNFIMGCRDKLQEVTVPPGGGERITSPVVNWCVPPFNIYKINTDAAVDVEKNRVGLGCIIRNSYGEVMAAAACPMAGDFSPLIAEGLAVSSSSGG
ncbi:hypothetical protein ACOSQ4_016987 [Xanthoceras sorbifolium]